MSKTIRVETPKGSCVGRNGYFDLKAVELYKWGDAVKIAFIGKSGAMLNAGAYVTPEQMDTLCRQWLTRRVVKAKKKEGG